MLENRRFEVWMWKKRDRNCGKRMENRADRPEFSSCLPHVFHACSYGRGKGEEKFLVPMENYVENVTKPCIFALYRIFRQLENGPNWKTLHI